MSQRTGRLPIGNPARRDILKVGGIGVAAASLGACDALSTDPAGEEETGTATGPKGMEAPALADLVEKGDLPPVEDRLPKEPLVVEPTNEPGQYGGERELVMFRGEVGNPSDRLNTTIGYEQLVRWKPGASDLTEDQVLPNVAKDFTIEADGAEFIFTLREGMKWSDGEDFTADDILFWYDDIVTNTELSPVFPDWLTTDGEPGVVEKIDDYTVAFRFAKPNGLFLINMASQRGLAPTNHPAHYLREFHPDNVDDVDALIAEAGVENVTDLMASKLNLFDNPERPVLNAWMITEPIGASTERVVAERNPYYWKTDSDGSQLPYIDRMAFTIFESEEPATLRVINGEIDTIDRGLNTLMAKPDFARGREQGNYDFFDTVPQQMNQLILMVNLTHQKPELREVFTNKDFRIGVSHAINRAEIIDAVYASQGEPWQAAPRPESAYYNERLAKQYTEYDVDLANEHLDKVLPDKDSDGFRLGTDGNRFQFIINYSSAHALFVDALELIKGYWEEVGIQINIAQLEGSLFLKRVEANEHDAVTWVGGGGLGVPLDPFYYMPYNFNTRYAMPWHFWYLDPEDERAEEPPEVTRHQVDLYRQLLASGDEAERDALMNEILEIAADEFYCLGIALRKDEYGIFSNRLRNTPEVSVMGWLHAELMPTNPQQYYISDE